jgi:hypothetical protein
LREKRTIGLHYPHNGNQDRQSIFNPLLIWQTEFVKTKNAAQAKIDLLSMAITEYVLPIIVNQPFSIIWRLPLGGW